LRVLWSVYVYVFGCVYCSGLCIYVFECEYSASTLVCVCVFLSVFFEFARVSRTLCTVSHVQSIHNKLLLKTILTTLLQTHKLVSVCGFPVVSWVCVLGVCLGCVYLVSVYGVVVFSPNTQTAQYYSVANQGIYLNPKPETLDPKPSNLKPRP
jgi:hypothetical protein